jgi:hypothetical protein
VLVRLDHAASRIVDANHGIVRAGERHKPPKQTSDRE